MSLLSWGQATVVSFVWYLTVAIMFIALALADELRGPMG